MPISPAHLLGIEQEDGATIGRDPRTMDVPELNAMGFTSNSLTAAVRAKCMDCCGDNGAEVRRCTATACPLWPFRMGSNPLTRRQITEEQRQTLRDRGRASGASPALGTST